ncbi:MAG: polysaccharide deacetylase family protein [Verrucomicrobiota bacterium]|jgi:peptidoglycan/xylan/chitin deacetylase (PgdA/CDA1 family)
MKLLLPILIIFSLAPTHAVAGEPNTNVVHVALVFDDGPFPEHASKLLALFAKEHIHVTFSSVVTNVELHPATAKAVLAAGHEIANHSYAHHHPKDLDDAALEHEIAGAQKSIVATTGFTPKWYWPPYLESDERVRATAAKAQLQVYVPRHLVVSGDYDRAVGAEEIQRKATSNIVDGTVIVFHEWRDETYDRMPAIIAELRRQRCVFLTFSELAAYLDSQKQQP